MQIDRKQSRDLLKIWGCSYHRKTEFVFWMNSQMACLTDKQFEVVSLMYIDDMSVRGIAKELELAEVTIKNRLTVVYDKLSNVISSVPHESKLSIVKV